MIRVLSIKSAEKICIPGTRLVDLLREVMEVVSPVVQHLGDDEGTFQRSGELVRPLLIQSEDEISLLECPTLDTSGMETTKVLLIKSRPYQGNLSFFLQKINCVLPCIFCFGF